MALSILGVIFGSCDSLIYDNLEDCPQGVYVKFYSMTPCDADSTFLGEVGKLTLFAFDEQGLLAATHEEANANLTKDYEVLVPVRHGTYTFVAWAGLNDKFDVSDYKEGTTTRDDVMATLKSADGLAAQLGQDRVYQGQSRAVSLADPAIFGTEYKYTAVNLREMTNRVKLIVEVDHENTINKLPNANDIQVAVKSANGTVRVDGTTTRKATQLEYPARDTQLGSADVAEWNFSLMDLVTGLQNDLELSYYNEETEEVEYFFDETGGVVDLIGMILLERLDNTSGGVSLACENDFEIKLKVIDRCAHCGVSNYSCDIYINNWKVHSYDTKLEF